MPERNPTRKNKNPTINQSISSLTSAQAIQHGNFELRKMQEICQKQIQVHTNPKEPRKAHSNIAEAGSQNKQSLKNIAEAAGQDKTKSLSQDHCSRTGTNTNNPSRSPLQTKEKLEKEPNQSLKIIIMIADSAGPQKKNLLQHVNHKSTAIYYHPQNHCQD
jgi:hypothetical protein